MCTSVRQLAIEANGSFQIGRESRTCEIRTSEDAEPTIRIVLEEIDLRVKDSTRLKNEAGSRVIDEGLEEVRMGLVEMSADDEL
jgi:hypothetical protein